MRAEVEDFDVLENRARQNKQFYGKTLRRLRLKVNNYEALLHSEPYEDARPDDKLTWYNKLNKVVKDDCGLARLDELREENRRRLMINAKENYNLLDPEPHDVTAASGDAPGGGRSSQLSRGLDSRNSMKTLIDKATADPKGSSPVIVAPASVESPSSVSKAKKKDSKKKKNAKDQTIDWKSQMGFGSKPEFQPIRVIPNYVGGPRQLMRLGPRGELPVEMQGLPPWLGPGAYSKETADKILFDRQDKHYMVPFQSVSREGVTIDDVREKIKRQKEWHAQVRDRRQKLGNALVEHSSSLSDFKHSEGSVLNHIDSFQSSASKRRHRFALMLPSGSLESREVREQLMKSFQKPNKLGYMKLMNESVILEDMASPAGSAGSLSRKDTIETTPSFDPDYGNVVKPSAIISGEGLREDAKKLYATDNHSVDDSTFSFFGDESDLSVSSYITSNVQSQVPHASQSKALGNKSKRSQVSTGLMSKGTSKREPKKPREIGDYTKGGLDNLSSSIIEPLSYSDTPVEEGLNLYRVGFASSQLMKNMEAEYASNNQNNPASKSSRAASKETGSKKNVPSSYKPHGQSLSALSSGVSKNSKPSRMRSRHLEPLQPSPRAQQQHAHAQSAMSLSVEVSALSMDDHVAGPEGWEVEQSSLSFHAQEGEMPVSIDLEASLSLSLQTSSQISRTGSVATSEVLYQNLYDECVRACRSTSASQQLSPLDKRLALHSRHNRSRQQSSHKHRAGSPSRITSAQGSLDSMGSDSLTHVGTIDLSGLLLPGEGVNVDGLAATYEPPPRTPDLTDKHRESHINGDEPLLNAPEIDSASFGSHID
jgi:hypothetical protein